jgi:ribulose-phosphate 3-epimerase
MVIPTVFVEKKENFEERFNLVLPLAEKIQIDIMDGIFVKKRSIPLNEIPSLKDIKKEFEAHLMVKFPKNYIEELSKKGFKKVIFHYETQPSDLDVRYLIAMIKRFKMEPMVAINPETPAENLYYLDTTNKVLLLGVNPGKENQKFIIETFEKIVKLKERGFFVQVDGGVNPEIAEKLSALGCDEINSGSYVSSSKNPNLAFKELELAFKKGEKSGKIKKKIIRN